MKKQELEELQRLEAELMATEYIEDELIDEIDLLEDTWQDLADLPVEAYNTDTVDVELDGFSEDVSQGKPSRSVLPKVLIAILSCIVIFCALKLLGVV